MSASHGSRAMAETDSGSQHATKDQILEKARADIGQGRADLEERNLEDGVRDVAIMLQERDVNLSGMNIHILPEELIDVIKDEVSRLALHRNSLKDLSGLAPRLHECTKIKYLVLRNNEIREFPQVILGLPQLEFLDIKNNKIESLPTDFSKLSRLRTLSISRNRLRRLPTCIAHMNALKIVEAVKNPIEFPPPEDWMAPEDDDHQTMKPSGDNIDFHKREAETKRIKHCLLEYSKQDRSRSNTDGEQSESNAETPKPARRKVSGRLPIRPSASGIELITAGSSFPPSPKLGKHSLPSKSYPRLANGSMNATAVRPGLAPLINSNLSDRHRSNSESGATLTIKEKRMGMVSRKEYFKNQLDEKTKNRLSHNRGLSHGSALHRGNAAMLTDSSDPPSPTEAYALRTTFEHRLSVLPEYKRKSHLSDPVIEFARGILFSLNQVASPIRGLLSVLKETGNNNPKRGGLERTCWTAFEFLADLNQQVQVLERLGENEEEDARRQSYTSIYSSCENCLRTFNQLGVSLHDQVRELVTRGSQQHVRSLMHVLYASLVEVRNACKKLGNVQFQSVPVQSHFAFPAPEDSRDQQYQRINHSGRPTTSVRRPSDRDRSGDSKSFGMKRSYHNPHQASFNTISRTASSASFNMPTPFSQDSFSSYQPSTTPTARSNSSPRFRAEENEEKQFAQIYHKLHTACDLAMSTLPACKDILEQSRLVVASMASEDEIEALVAAHQRCRTAFDVSRALKERLQVIKVKDPQARNQSDFWQMCTSFTRAHFVFTGQVRYIAAHTGPNVGLDDLKRRLKPLHFWVKDVGKIILKSPWGNSNTSSHSQSTSQPGSSHPVRSSSQASVNGHGHARNNQSVHARIHPFSPPLPPALQVQTRVVGIPAPNPLDPMSATSIGTISSNGGSISALSSGYTTPMPATPMSAALGPAASATVPALTDLPTAVHSSYFTQQTNQTGSGTVSSTNLERQKSVSGRR